MERIEKDYGYLVKENGEICNFEGGQTDNGFVYKDREAFKSGVGICYISEYELEDLEDKLTDLDERKKWLTAEDYLAERKKILEECGETRQSIIDQVREAFYEDYILTYEQIMYFAEDVFGLADWAYISTYLDENFQLEDCIANDDSGMFNELQHEAVDEGMTPKEYAESKGLKPVYVK